MRKKLSIEVGMLIFISLLVIIVSVSGIITYRNLSSLAFDLKKDGGADDKLTILKHIMADLYQAESNVRTYYFTRDHAYINSYDDSKTAIENKLTALEIYVQNDQPEKFRLDSIKELVNDKYLLLDTWINMERDEKVTKELNNLPEKLNPEKTISTIDDTSIKKRNKKKNIVDLELLKSEVRKVQKKQTSQLKELNEQELTLNIENKLINDALGSLIARMEKEEKESIMVANTHAIQKANVTNLIIATFCISSVFLLIIIGVTLYRYIVKARLYSEYLKNARLEAENLATAKQSFLANMTHEIRTPINAIIGFTEQLDKSQLSDQQKEYLHIVKKSSIHLLKIVNDVLDYSKLQAGKFTFEKIIFNPSDTIAEVIDILLPEAENKKIQLQFQAEHNIPESLLGDPFRLQQILLNIIGNAIKFTGSGVVAVSIKTEKSEANEVLFKMEIKDTGIGIPANKVEKIFDVFEQVETNISKKYRGTGLGLSITKKLVENQQGSIHIISKEGEGTIVNIVIPYELVSDHSLENTSEKQIDSKLLEKKRVLIVDDEPFNRKLLRTILEQWGAFIEEAHDGDNALYLLKNKQYDLILMDIRMPGMSGIEITQKIREFEEEEKKNTTIIALTASNDPEKEKKCLAAGMNAFLSKPFTEQRLFELISKVFSGLSSEIKNNIKLSIDELYKLGREDKGFLNKMLGLFIKGSEEAMTNIKNASELDDRKAIMEITHKIAPSCRQLGALRMHELIKRLEKNAGNGATRTDLNILVHELEVETKSTILEIRKYLV